MMLDIPDNIARRLQALAERNDRRVEDVLSDLLTLHDAAIMVAEGRKWATGADLARVAEKAALELEALRLEDGDCSQQTNTAENSRQILQEIYAEKFSRHADP